MLMCVRTSGRVANSVDADVTVHSAASDLSQDGLSQYLGQIQCSK